MARGSDLGEIGEAEVERQVPKRVGVLVDADEGGQLGPQQDDRLMTSEEQDMKIKVDFDLCETNGLCEGIAPEVFELDDDDFLQLKTRRPRPRTSTPSSAPWRPARAPRSPWRTDA